MVGRRVLYWGMAASCRCSTYAWVFSSVSRRVVYSITTSDGFASDIGGAACRFSCLIRRLKRQNGRPRVRFFRVASLHRASSPNLDLIERSQRRSDRQFGLRRVRTMRKD